MSDPRERWKDRGDDSAIHFAHFIGFEREFCETDDELDDLWNALEPSAQAKLYNFCWDLVARAVGENPKLPEAKVIDIGRKP